MSMTGEQNAGYQAEGAAANVLNDRLVAFNIAKAAATSAVALLDQRTTELAAAWTEYKVRDVAFTGLMLVAPEGFTPPT